MMFFHFNILFELKQSLILSCHCHYSFLILEMWTDHPQSSLVSASSNIVQRFKMKLDWKTRRLCTPYIYFIKRRVGLWVWHCTCCSSTTLLLWLDSKGRTSTGTIPWSNILIGNLGQLGRYRWHTLQIFFICHRTINQTYSSIRAKQEHSGKVYRLLIVKNTCLLEAKLDRDRIVLNSLPSCPPQTQLPPQKCPKL